MSQASAQDRLTPAASPRLRAQPRRRWRLPRRFKFTRIGRIFTGITVLVSIAAFNTGNNPLYLLFGMMLSLIIISGILSEAVLREMQVQRQFPQRLFAHQPALVSLKLKSLKRRIPSFSLQVTDRIQGLPAEQRPSVYFLRVDPLAEVSSMVQLTFPQRGLWRSEGFEISTSFPFEFFRKGIEWEDAIELIVYPSPAPPPPLPYLGSVPQGSQPRPRQGIDGEFFGLRDYRPSDDVRNIHWKISAKRDQLVTRELEQREAQTLTLCLYNAWIPYGHRGFYAPVDPATHRAVLEKTVETAAGLAQHLIGLGHPVALVTLDGRTPFGTSAQHLDLLFRTLALVTFHGDPEPVVGSDIPIPFLFQFALQPQDRCVMVSHGHTLPSFVPAQVVARILL